MALRTHAKWAKVEAFVCFAAHFWFHLTVAAARREWPDLGGVGAWVLGSGCWVLGAGVSYHYRRVKVQVQNNYGSGGRAAELPSWRTAERAIERGEPKLFALRANLIPFPHVRA